MRMKYLKNARDRSEIKCVFSLLDVREISLAPVSPRQTFSFGMRLIFLSVFTDVALSYRPKYAVHL